jgi:hypothetical protein
MKCLYSGVTLLLVFGVAIVVGARPALAEDPPWWEDECVDCAFRAYWDETAGGSTVECSYEPCDADCTALPSGEDIDVQVDRQGATVTVTIWNAHVPTNTKKVKIKVTGTGATGDPHNITVSGVGPTGAPQSSVTIESTSVDETGGTWSVEVEATLRPQPHRVVLTFQVPTAGRAVAATAAWAWECCSPTIPTVSEWGLIVLTLLLLTAGGIVIARRRRSAAA